MRPNIRWATLLLGIAILALRGGAVAQSVNCTVQVNFDAVATTYKELLRDFATDVQDYLSNYNFGGQESTEKIQCTLNIFINSATQDNKYTAQVFIGSQRPIFNTKQNTAVVRLLDDSWEFTYIKDRPFNHNMYSFNDLASFLDFYMLMILGYDADTYDKLGGNPYFQKAADIASMGASSGQKGWQSAGSGYQRVRILRELLSAQFEPVRIASYDYHYNGLDSLSLKPQVAYRNIIRALENIGKARTNIDPQNLVIRAFFETKYMEIASTFQNYPDPAIYARFSTIDPQHQKTYQEYMSKR
jgi:hypothetical protein